MIKWGAQPAVYMANGGFKTRNECSNGYRQVNALILVESAHDHLQTPPIPPGSPLQASIADFNNG
jgi:hypothetical protein